MDLKIGVIGTGFIGRDHIKRISTIIKGAKVVAVNDIDEDTAQKVAREYGAKFYSTGKELINAPEVEAVLIASWDPTHAEFVLEAVKVQKHVFCEKPLATSADDCMKIIKEEIAGGKQLVQVGFMRRYDRGYRQIKAVIDSGEIGIPLMVHCVHRNQAPGPTHTTEMNIKNSVVHEIDLLRWLLNEEYKSAQVLIPRTSRHAKNGLIDPQIVLLETQTGIRIDVESFVNCQYGYDVQCEVVGEDGTVRLPDPANVIKRSECSYSYEIFADWSDRFCEAYNIEIQEWVNSVKSNELKGPNSWDGYMACVIADLCTEARIKGNIVSIPEEKSPEFYFKKEKTVF